jgi:hypothetical protein
VRYPISLDIVCPECGFDGAAPLVHDETRGWFVTCPECRDDWTVDVPPPITGEGTSCRLPK